MALLPEEYDTMRREVLDAAIKRALRPGALAPREPQVLTRKDGSQLRLGPGADEIVVGETDFGRTIIVHTDGPGGGFRAVYPRALAEHLYHKLHAIFGPIGPGMEVEVASRAPQVEAEEARERDAGRQLADAIRRMGADVR